MKPAPFEYVCRRSLEEAVELLEHHGVIFAALTVHPDGVSRLSATCERRVDP